jgi:hypothetical protein
MPLNCLRTLEELFDYRCIAGVGQCRQGRINAEVVGGLEVRRNGFLVDIQANVVKVSLGVAVVICTRQ